VAVRKSLDLYFYGDTKYTSEARRVNFHRRRNNKHTYTLCVNIICTTVPARVAAVYNFEVMPDRLNVTCTTVINTGILGYNRIYSTKSPASCAGNVNEPQLMSQDGRVRKVVCALISGSTVMRGEDAIICRLT